MKISIIHPSKGRPEMAHKTIKKWLAYADNEIEYILSLDSDDAHWYLCFMKSEWLGFDNPKVKFRVSNNNSAIEAINVAAKEATGDLFIVVSDDFICPKHWDTKLKQALEGKSDFLVKTRDGLQKTLITLPIMDRVYYNRFGYIYHPDYLHMHCDEEMTIVGHMLGRVINVDLTFEHLHYTTGKMKMDAINEKNNATWAHGQRTLDRRAQNNFGIENPLIKREEIIWK